MVFEEGKKRDVPKYTEEEFILWRAEETTRSRTVRSSFRDGDRTRPVLCSRFETIVCLFVCLPGDGLSEAVTRRSLSDGLR